MKNVGNSSRGRSQGVMKIFRAPYIGRIAPLRGHLCTAFLFNIGAATGHFVDVTRPSTLKTVLLGFSGQGCMADVDLQAYLLSTINSGACMFCSSDIVLHTLAKDQRKHKIIAYFLLLTFTAKNASPLHLDNFTLKNLFCEHFAKAVKPRTSCVIYLIVAY